MIDKVSTQRIQTLLPSLRQEATMIIEECNNVLTGRAKAFVVFALRTMKEQEDIYNQGRTKPGPIVTNAKPGQSYHNWGVALDVALLIDGKTISWDTTKDWDNDKKADWMEIVAIFKKHGWEWGGNWESFKDMPHFEKRIFNGKRYSWHDFQTMKKDKAGYIVFSK